MRFQDGEVLDRNFDTYQIPRFSWLPKIETILMDNPGAPAGAGGEPPIITMGALDRQRHLRRGRARACSNCRLRPNA